MDRLFGKEVSNLLDPHFHINKTKLPSRIPSKSIRVQGHDENIPVSRKAQKISVSANHYVKPIKEQQAKISKGVQESSQIKDVQLVPEYFDQCFSFMLDQEQKYYQLNNYMDLQAQINDKMRGILLEWIAELHHKFKMFPETLYTVAMIIDKYLSKKIGKKDNLQLVGIAAFYIASKYEQTYHIPELQELVHFAAKAFTKNDIIKMQADILQTLDFDLIMITSYRFFEALSKISKMDMKNFHLTQYVLELALLDIKFLQCKPSLLASSAIYLINKIRKRPQSWSDLMVAATGYEQKDLKFTARQLCFLLEKANDLPNTKSLKKKFSSIQYNQVTRIKLERKKQ